ncbi:MAG TPA: MFS transporter [Solirubrobacter sp.]|nr:MFS transporter [Solirubrobacter sp.]
MSKYAGNRWVTLVLVCLAQFMVILDATIVNIALPAIQTDLDFSDANLQWVVNGYTLLFGGFLLLGGRAADIVGRKRIFIAGVILFSVASLLNGLATSAGQLVAFRALQGLGGALVSPAALSIITTTFAEGAERTKALGVWGAIAAGGGAFGLLLGGVLVETLSWEWVFFVNVPVGIAAAVLSSRLIVESKNERAGAFDIAGAVLVTSGLMVLVYAIVRANENGWGSAETLGFGAVALALLTAFFVVESRIRGPLVRLDIFKIRSLAVANGVLLLIAGGLFALFFFASLYVQRILGFSPIEAGLAFLPVTAGILIGSVTAQAGVKRFGALANTLVGMVIAAAGLFLLAGVPVADGSYLTDLLPGLVLMAFGMGNTFVPITLIATTGVQPGDAGLASGIFNTSQQVGGALGLAVLSTLAANETTSYLQGLGHRPVPAELSAGLVEGYQVAFTAAAFLVAAGAVLMALLLRRRHVPNVSSEAEPAGAYL